MKRRRAREHDQDVAREQADRRREELLARLRGGPPPQAEPAEPADQPDAETVDVQPEAPESKD